MNINNEENSISLRINESSTEMIRIAPNGFYVRGVKVAQSETEAKSVYDDAFVAWLDIASKQTT